MAFTRGLAIVGLVLQALICVIQQFRTSDHLSNAYGVGCALCLGMTYLILTQKP